MLADSPHRRAKGDPTREGRLKQWSVRCTREELGPFFLDGSPPHPHCLSRFVEHARKAPTSRGPRQTDTRVHLRGRSQRGLAQLVQATCPRRPTRQTGASTCGHPSGWQDFEEDRELEWRPMRERVRERSSIPRSDDVGDEDAEEDAKDVDSTDDDNVDDDEDDDEDGGGFDDDDDDEGYDDVGGVMMMLVMCVLLGVRGWYLFLEQGHRPRHRGGCQNGSKAATVQSKGETGNAGHCCSLNYSPDHSFGRSDGRCAPWSVQTCKAAS